MAGFAHGQVHSEPKRTLRGSIKNFFTKHLVYFFTGDYYGSYHVGLKNSYVFYGAARHFTFREKVTNHFNAKKTFYTNKISYVTNNWLLSTNHRRIAVLYFIFIIVASFAGLGLATAIRAELATPGVSIFSNNSEKYLTVVSLHAIVMVFFVVIPVLFGAFGNFLLPTQLGVRDVAFPRLNSFMFWVTPSGFVLLLHVFFFDKTPSIISPSMCRSFKKTYTNTFDSCGMGKAQFLTIEESGAFDVFEECSGGVTDNHLSWANTSLKVKLIRVGALLKEWFYPENFDYDRGFSEMGYTRNYFSYQLWQAHNYRCGSLDTFKRFVDVWVYLTQNVLSVVADGGWKNFYIKISSWVSNQLIPGWAFITPYSSRLKFSALGKVDVVLVVVFMAGLGSVFSAVNYVITYRCVSSPVFKNRRELRSFFVDALLVGSRMMLAANPALLIAILFLLSDRHCGTSIFDFSGGGDAVLFQHLFWFFGHPEVYIIIIPCFGFANSLLPHFLRKRLSGRLSLQFSMYTIAFMGFAVWGHHMYMVGLANTTRTLYSTMTVMISVPASTKVLHWCVSMVNGAPQYDVSYLFLLAFTYFFTLGGLSGMFNAHIGFDVTLHDTFYVIGHFHVMLAGAAFSCIFAAFYFYFSSIFGVQYTKFFATMHFIFYFFGQLLTVIPMFWLGYSGMPRRILDYPAYFGGWHSIISGGHMLSVISFIFFLLMLLDSFYIGAVPKSRTHGIPRLNTRLSFYTYERAKYNYLRSTQV